MKKELSLVLFSLSCIMQLANAKNDKKLLKKNNLVVQQALVNKDFNSEKVPKCGGFAPVESMCCERGPRGHRGHRGRTGLTGATGNTGVAGIGITGATGATGAAAACGLDELFINAEMMRGGKVEGFDQVPTKFLPYGSFAPYVIGWPLPFPDDFPPVGAVLDLPVDMDLTQPVTAVLYVLIDSSVRTGTLAALSVSLDIEPSNGLIGNTPPATGPIFVGVSSDFLVTPAAPSLSDNLRQIEVPIVLNLSAATPGGWVIITSERIRALTDDYAGDIYLSDIAFQYSRLCLPLP